MRTLPNGVTLLAAPMPQLASAAVAVFVRAGSRDEPAEQAGIGHFLEHMAFKGTATRSVQEINFAAESLGADMNAYTDKDATCFHLEGLGAHVPRMLELLADIVLNGTFPAEEIERERAVILQECTEYAEDPEQLSFQLLDDALWHGHPMARPIIGTPQSIRAIGRQQLLAHVAAHYTGERIVVAAAGGFDVDAFFDQGALLFAGVRGAGPYAPPGPPPHVGEARARRLAGVSQTYITLAWTLATRAEHPQLAPLAATLFGGGMSAPLVDTVRERLGLAYSVGASADVSDAHGVLMVDATTTPDKLPAFSEALAGLLAAQAQGVSANDLARARNQLLVSLVRSTERPFAMLQRCVEHLWATGELFDLRRQMAAVEGIGSDELQAAFARMLAHPAATVLVGAGATVRNARGLRARLALS